MAKYRPFPKVKLSDRRWPEQEVTKAPIWCSVDLRDGNQALAVPMNIEEKLEMFDMLVDVGFKEIEVGFPSASNTEFQFVRRLIDENRIPDDVTIQVLTQAREQLIRKSFEAVAGARRAIIHLYNSTSALQRKITFNMSQAQIKEIAIEGTKLVKELVSSVPETKILLEYSPESFSDTEVEFALEVCEAVQAIWKPTPSEKMIMNLPDTVEWAPPNVYADQIEWFCRNLADRQSVVVSVHTHNDRGTGVAATELGMMAGAERVEGTLFGNGERTGNLDIVTVALNLFSDGVDPGLKLFDLPSIQEVYERTTRMEVPPRQPYAGELVFTAFSGSHQDAIKKGMDRRDATGDPQAPWEVPYLTIDPRDIGRTYQAIIRINSQSGKGGVAYILSRNFGYDLPKKMHPEVGEVVNAISDELARELKSEEIFEIFKREYLGEGGGLKLVSLSESPNHEGGVSSTECQAVVSHGGKNETIVGRGTGPIDAFVSAMKQHGWDNFQIAEFHEDSLGKGSQTQAVAYIKIESTDGTGRWGAGVDTNITVAGVKALLSAFARLSAARSGSAAASA
ncbi:MAG TPA: 2-isopropylmalate synthase [Spirochaetia bacterium]|nr:2-isopropylmalate synthase [Spirochaetia bacterium]